MLLHGAAAMLMVSLSLLLAAAPNGTAEGRRTRLTWVNGIGHSLEHMEEGREFISQKFGGKPVVYCHNPTAMAHEDDIKGYVYDLTQAGTQKLGYITAEVDSLVEHLRDAISAVGRRGLIVHISHSQGALITALAARRLTPDEMEKIEVVSLGGAAVLRKTPQTPFRRCVNYYSVNDPLLLVVPQAAQALRSGFASHGGGGGGGEFCFLSPRVGDPIQDHSLFSPTYGQALEWEGARFQRLYVSPLHRFARKLALLCLVLFETLSANLNAALKALLRPILLWCILIWLWTRSTYVQASQSFRTRIAEPLIASSSNWKNLLLKKNATEPVAVPS